MSLPTSNPIRLVVGLGNPGAKYEETRHNAGFWWIDELAARHRGSFRLESKFHGAVARIDSPVECWLLRPDTFMNRSGQAVAALMRFYRIPLNEILVIHDELDLAPGTLRLKQGGGHGGHNGLRDIITAGGGADFWRLRLGIGHPGDARQVVDYVLTRPSQDDRISIRNAIERSLEAFPLIARGDQQRVMNQLHRAP